MGILKKIKRFLNLPFSRKLQILTMRKQRLVTEVFYRHRLQKCGKHNIIAKPIFWTPEYIELGNNILIWPGSRFEGVSEYNENKYNPKLIIGNNTTIQQNCHITFADEMIIGNNVTISFNVSIQDSDHYYNEININILNQKLKIGKVIIGDFCFLGSGSKILSGTVLGKQCIIGTNAVVRGQFPDYCVIAGIPARIIKRYDPITKEWEKTNEKGEFIE